MASVKSFCAKNVTPHYFLLKFITKIEINNFDAASIFMVQPPPGWMDSEVWC